MPVVRAYPVGEVESRPTPNAYPQVAAAGDASLFGGSQARDMQVAGANLERTSDNLGNMALRMFKEANDTKVEGDLNTFLEGKQKALIDYTQTKGQDAIDGAKTVSDNLLSMKTRLLDGAKNAYQRDALSKRLDAQMLDATGTVTTHVAQQSRALQVTTLNARSDLTVRQGVMDRNDAGKIEGQLGAMATLGLEKARLAGLPPDSEGAKLEVLKEQEKYLVGVIQAKITDGDKRTALALYDKYPGILKHNASVDSVMKGVRTEIDGENVANDALRKSGMPSTGSGGDKDQFIQKMTPHALEVSKATGLDPRLVIAQSALETGWGAGAPGNNYFGVKSHGKPGGQTLDTTEVGPGGEYRTKGSFRAYGSAGESAADYTKFLKENSRYAPVMAAKGLDAQIDAMGKSGYASDPNYASKLRQIAQSLPDMTGGEGGAFGGTIINARGGSGGQTLYKGDLKAGYEQAKAEVQNNTSLSPEVRASALATLNKTAANVTSYQTAATKALKDEADSYRLNSYLSPTGPDPAKLASFATRAEALGEQALASTYRVIAAVAPTATNSLQSMPADQLKMLKAMEEGPAAKLIEGLTSGRGETLTQANDAFDKLKKAHASGLDPAGLKDMATAAAKLYADAGKSEKAREVAQTYGTMMATSEVLKANPVQQKQALAEIEGIASTGQVNEEQAALHSQLKQGIATQATEFDKDAYSAGRKLYGMPTLPITDGAARAEQANTIAQRRGLRPDQVATMSDEEFTSIRSQAGASPQAAQKLLQSIAVSYPPEAIPQIGAGIAGKANLSDPQSMGYAAVLSFYADGEPDIANTILDGLTKRKAMGNELRDFPKSDVFHDKVQTKMGNAFVSLDGKVPAMVINAAEQIYTSKMIAAGRQGEKVLDDTVFEQALTSVIGKPFALNGQMLVPPKGVESYQFSNALRYLPDDNVVGLRTLNGTPVTGEKIARYGMFSNAGKDGTYFVQMPDPARAGAPSYVQGPDGQPLTVNIKPLLERAKQFPMQLPSENAAAAARRRAPASPTDGVDPLGGAQRFGGDGFGGGGEGGRPLWRDAPSLFEGPESDNVIDRRDSPEGAQFMTVPVPRPTDGPPSGLAVPSRAELEGRADYQRGHDAVDVAVEEARLRREKAKKDKKP